MIPVKDRIGKKSYSPYQNWAGANPVHASELMKEVFYNKEAAKNNGLKLGKEIYNHFTETSIIKKLLKVFQE